MPKGDGTLEALQSSLKIYYKYKKQLVSNDQFKKEIAIELDLGDGRDGPFLLKKSEIGRYFGLINYSFSNKKGMITERGIRFYESETLEDKIDIIFESVFEDSFGKKNFAIKSGNSRIDPPKLLVKSINVLNEITKKEFSYLLYSLADLNNSLENSLLAVEISRDKKLDPPEISDHLTKKYTDIKFIVFFENMKILKKDKNTYSFENYVSKKFREQISSLSIYNDV